MSVGVRVTPWWAPWVVWMRVGARGERGEGEGAGAADTRGAMRRMHTRRRRTMPWSPGRATLATVPRAPKECVVVRPKISVGFPIFGWTFEDGQRRGGIEGCAFRASPKP